MQGVERLDAGPVVRSPSVPAPSARCRRSTPRPWRGVGVVVAAGLLVVGACGDDAGEVADERSVQVRTAALDAGLPAEVADVLALAARGGSATFQVSYPAADGTAIVVSQDPPDRRIDALEAGLIVESQVLVDGISYRCTLPDGGRAGDDLRCRRTSAALPGTGAFTEAALTRFTEDLAASLGTVELTVESRTVASTEVTCLVASPTGAEEGAAAGPDTICVAGDGTQLLVDVGGERMVADGYSREVPEGTFEL